MKIEFELTVGRIERLALDAIVNAANAALLPGAGVDGAIRSAAGPDLDQALARFGGLATGAAILTPGFKAPARFIVHTVAPIRGALDPETEDTLLARAYRSSIAAADAAGLETLAFPALGTGFFGWPMAYAAAIAVASTRRAAAQTDRLRRIVFCCFTEEDSAIYAPLLSP